MFGVHPRGNVSNAGMRILGNVELEDGDESAIKMSWMEWLEVIREQVFGFVRRSGIRLCSPFIY